MTKLLKVENLTKKFPVKSGFLGKVSAWVRAVSGVSFEINAGETLGLVGESGCGKTTLSRMIARLIEPDEGKILFEREGETMDLRLLSESKMRKIRGSQISMIFQDPYSSLNPRMKIGDIVAEPLEIHKQVSWRDKKKKVGELLEQVGLSKDFYDRYPHEFSGGQRQRVGIARAIAVMSKESKLIIADEPVSALDVSVAAQIVNLLQDLQEKSGISYLFISHDLKMVNYLSHRIMVMYLGKIVEMGPKSEMLKPLHPYTQALISAIPVPDPQNQKTQRKRIILSGEIPSPMSPPSGCSFHTRCPFAEAKCREEEPALKEWQKGHWAACHFVEKIQK